MAVRIKAYYETRSGGPANAAWRYWLDNIHDHHLTMGPSSLASMNEQIKLFKIWLRDEYGAKMIDSEWWSELEFENDAMATLFSMRFT